MSDKTSNRSVNDIIFTDSNYELLTIDPTTWRQMYDADFTPYLEVLSHNGARYVSWSYITLVLKENFPTADVEFERNPAYPDRVFHTQPSLLDTTNIVNNLGLESDESKIQVFNSLRQEPQPYLLPFLYDRVTLKRTRAMFFPLLGRGNKVVTGYPDSFTLNKNIMRAKVKVVALETGYGLRAWTGEDFDTEKIGFVTRINEVNDEYKKLAGENHELIQTIHLGLSIKELTKIGKQVKDDLTKLIQK